MSLTSQIRNKNSPVRQFFTKYENKNGMKNCLRLLQSTAPLRQLPFTPSSKFVSAFIGTTTDYLIRYVASGNRLQFENTIASRALENAGSIPEVSDIATKRPTPPPKRRPRSIGEALDDRFHRFHFAADRVSNSNEVQHLANLLKIGKQHLDGTDASDYKAIYSATALAVMDNFYRSGRLPGIFLELISKERMAIIRKSKGANLGEKITRHLLNEYFFNLGGDQYALDISDLIQLFMKSCKDPASELFGAKFVMLNKRLRNAHLVGGADFDCVIDIGNRLVLTDIKTSIKRLKMEHLRQILGYALLHDEKKDNFGFTDIGVYHSRAGSLRYIPVSGVIETALEQRQQGQVLPFAPPPSGQGQADH